MLATLAVRARSSVERDSYTREITLVHPREAPGRLALGLLRLLQGCRAVGADSATAWRVVAKVALDCIPPIRMAVLSAVAPEPLTTSALALRLDYPVNTVRRAAEDLTAHGVLYRSKETEKQNSADIWAHSEWTRTRWERIVDPEECVSNLSVDTGEGKERGPARQHSPSDNSEALQGSEDGFEALTDGDFPVDLDEAMA